jgi:hypothetical protein
LHYSSLISLLWYLSLLQAILCTTTIRKIKLCTCQPTIQKYPLFSHFIYSVKVKLFTLLPTVKSYDSGFYSYSLIICWIFTYNYIFIFLFNILFLDSYYLPVLGILNRIWSFFFFKYL